MPARFFGATVTQIIVPESIELLWVAPDTFYLIEDAVGYSEQGACREYGAVWQGNWLQCFVKEANCRDKMYQCPRTILEIMERAGVTALPITNGFNRRDSFMKLSNFLMFITPRFVNFPPSS